MSIFRSILLALALALIFPPLAHRLPYYPSWLEKAIARYYEAREANTFGSSVTTPSFLQMPEIVNRGGHFKQRLKDAHKANSSMFFEGWYHKLVTADQRYTMIIIPAVFFDGRGERNQAFIMAGLAEAGSKADADFYRYNIKETEINNYRGDTYKFEIQQNVFTGTNLKVDIDGKVTGEVTFSNGIEYPRTLLYPNVMGWFSYIDATVGMQCVHKVVLMDAVLKGRINFKGKEIDFTNGRIYVEGDYGSEFPSKYVWTSSNHFSNNPGSSFLLSVATIPFPNQKLHLFEFIGFLSFLYDKKNDKIYRFATYTGASVDVKGFHDGSLKGKEVVQIVLKDAQYILTVEAKGKRDQSAVLWGPREVDGVFDMRRYVHEMLNAEIRIHLRSRLDNATLFEDVGQSAGLEIEV